MYGFVPSPEFNGFTALSIYVGVKRACAWHTFTGHLVVRPVSFSYLEGIICPQLSNLVTVTV